ncbi:hypothetical protein [uncultured Legionella sp.]|uniref:hypothetical protein n=1 Tax=uncultured Legionella sp. TaxID=210934 RepID=UPI00261DA60C|nr:hypothetical protein [uncultured Legionella sp.]
MKRAITQNTSNPSNSNSNQVNDLLNSSYYSQQKGDNQKALQYLNMALMQEPGNSIVLYPPC